MTPSLLESLPDPALYQGVRRIFLGGESPSPKTVKKWWLPSRRIYNCYGPTEGTIAASVAEMLPGAPITITRGPMKPKYLVLLDSALRECQDGEICVAGSRVTVGYHRNPELTAQRFIAWNGQRLYRTSDFGRLTEQGIRFLGRQDSMAKNRGFLVNIEAEVIPLLLSQRQVQAAAALMHNKRLVAFVTPVLSPSETREIRQSLLSNHDQFVVPDVIRTQDRLPLTANGKADMCALKKLLDTNQVESYQPGYSAPSPSNCPLAVLKHVVSEALTCPISSLDDEMSLKDAGLNSMFALEMLSSLRERELDVKVSEIFQSTSLVALAGLLRPSKSITTPPPPGRHRPVAVPMTIMQMGVVRSTTAKQGSGYMLVSTTLVGMNREEVERRRLRDCWRAVMERHSIFRTAFDVANGTQIVTPSYEHDWQEIFPTDDSNTVDVSTQAQHDLLEVARKRSGIASDGLFRPANIFRLLLADKPKLLWLVHHSQIDGWSMGVIIRQVRSLLLGRDVIPQTPPQFHQFASALPSSSVRADPNFWLEKMSAVLHGSPLNVPTPTSASSDTRGTNNNQGTFGEAQLHVGFSRSDADMNARPLSVSPAVVFYTGWALLLSSYSSKRDVVFGTVFTGRSFPVPQASHIVGPMINTCPLPVTNLGTYLPRPKTHLLDKVRELVLEMGEHQWDAADALQIIARGSHSRIFQTMLFLEHDLSIASPDEDSELARWEFARTDMPEFGLTVFVHLEPGTDDLVFRAIFDTQMYDLRLVRGMLEHFRRLCLSLLDPRIHTVKDVRQSMLGAREFMGLVKNLPNYYEPYSGPPTLKDAFEDGVGRWPDQLAVESFVEGESLRYSELDFLADKVAHEILNHANPGETIALLSDGSALWLIGVIAIIKAGACYLPVDAELPLLRIQAVMEASAATLCLFPSKSVRARMSQDLHKRQMFVYGSFPKKAEVGVVRASRPPTTATPDSHAYVVFTSGSTGTPKGVRISHRSTLSHLSYEPARLHARPGTRHAQMFAPGFDVCMAEIFGTLCYGGTLVLKHPSGDRFAHLGCADRTMITPSFLSLCNPEALTNLKAIYLIGEAVPQALADAWSAGGKRLVYNAYGPCECTIACLFSRLQPGTPVTLGRPIPRVAVCILDQDCLPVPVGVAGEICVSGVQVCAGYVGADMEAASNLRFIPHPFRHGERMHRTGDIGAWTDAMEVRFLGRADNQVKVRGHRVELEEVENALRLSSTSIKQAAVVVCEDSLVGFVTPKHVNTKAISRSLRSKLPHYCCPSTTIALANLPSTVNQKIDRKKLLELAGGGTSEARNVQEPRTRMEKLVASVWREMIGLPSEAEVGIDTDFLDLGGNSLGQIRVAQRLSTILGDKIPLKTVVANTVLVDLAAAVDAHHQTRSPIAATSGSLSAPQVPNPGPTSRQPSYLEEEMFALHSTSPTPSTLNVGYEVEFSGPLHLDHLRDSIYRVFKKHEVLSDCFDLEGGILVVRKCPADFRIGDAENTDSSSEDHIITKAFDISNECLTRAAILRRGEKRHSLILVQHHIITDKSCTRLLFRQILDDYLETVMSRSAVLTSGHAPTTTTTNKNRANHSLKYSGWARLTLNRTVDDLEPAKISYWRQHLKGVPPRPFTAAKPQKLSPSKAAFWCTELSSTVEPRGCLAFYLAALCWALHRVVGLAEVIVGIPFIDRTEPGAEHVVGLFLDRLPIRISFSDSRRCSLRALTAFTASEIKSAISHALSMRHLREIACRDNLFDVMFVYNGRDDCVARDFSLPGVTITERSRRAPGAKFPLLVEVSEEESSVSCEFEYFADLVDERTVQSIGADMKTIISECDDVPIIFLM